jgi:hypothetical protein
MTAPKWLTWVSIIALLWNLMGLASAIMDAAGAGPPLTLEQATYASSIPVWATVGTWLAVAAGVAGSVCLWRRSRLAVPSFALSLAGVIMQDIWFAMSDVVTLFGVEVVILQGLVLVIAIALLWLAISARNKGWLR